MVADGDSAFQASVSAGIVSLGQVTPVVTAAESFEIRSRDGDKCLTVNLENSDVEVLPCQGSSNQEWYQDSDFVRSSHDDRCLTSASSNPIFVVDCDANNATHLWTMPTQDGPDDQIKSNTNSECLKHFVDEGSAMLAACEAAPAFSWYRETRGAFYSSASSAEISPNGNLGDPLPRIEDCRKECYAQENCCGFVVVDGSAGCQMKDKARGCRPFPAVGKTSYTKTVSVSAEYQLKASLTPDVGRGAVAMGSSHDGVNHCMAECFKDKGCCGYTVVGAVGSEECQMFSTCTPVKPAYGTTLQEKADATQGWF